MHIESIIKLIGRRPVYRVDRSIAPTPSELGENVAGSENGAPVMDQDERYRLMSGAEDWESEQGVY
jgi:hypothetical protein